MTSGYFITGTDTAAGKTFVACRIISVFTSLGMRVGVMKPVESGCRTVKGRLQPGDAIALRRATKSRQALDAINPYRFKSALSPNVAARLEKKRIDLKRIKAAYRTIASKNDVVIVEGAGGILSPITDAVDNAGLAKMLGVPVVIVVPDRLGAINQALLAIEAARRRGLKVALVVLNRKGRKKQVHNKSEIERIARVRVTETE